MRHRGCIEAPEWNNGQQGSVQFHCGHQWRHGAEENNQQVPEKGAAWAKEEPNINTKDPRRDSSYTPSEMQAQTFHKH